VKSKGTRITAQAPHGRDTFRAITAKTGVSLVNVVASRGLWCTVFCGRYLRHWTAMRRRGSGGNFRSEHVVHNGFEAAAGRAAGDLERIADVTVKGSMRLSAWSARTFTASQDRASVFDTVANAQVNIP